MSAHNINVALCLILCKITTFYPIFYMRYYEYIFNTEFIAFRMHLVAITANRRLRAVLFLQFSIRLPKPYRADNNIQICYHLSH